MLDKLIIDWITGSTDIASLHGMFMGRHIMEDMRTRHEIVGMIMVHHDQCISRKTKAIGAWMAW